MAQLVEPHLEPMVTAWLHFNGPVFIYHLGGPTIWRQHLSRVLDLLGTTIVEFIESALHLDFFVLHVGLLSLAEHPEGFSHHRALIG